MPSAGQRSDAIDAAGRGEDSQEVHYELSVIQREAVNADRASSIRSHASYDLAAAHENGIFRYRFMRDVVSPAADIRRLILFAQYRRIRI